MLSHLFPDKTTKQRSMEIVGNGESSELPGVAITHLANDPNIVNKAGKLITTADLSNEYGFTDIDGSQPADNTADRTAVIFRNLSQNRSLSHLFSYMPRNLFTSL